MLAPGAVRPLQSKIKIQKSKLVCCPASTIKIQKSKFKNILATFSLALCLVVQSADVWAGEPFWRAGVAKADITPTEPLWLAGYASREKPADGKVTQLWIKALALEDAAGHLRHQHLH